MNRSTNLVEMLEHYCTTHSDSFPEQGKVNYANRYKQLSEHLNNNVHPQVEKAALLEDAQVIRKVLAGSLQGDDIDLGTVKEWSETGIPSMVYLNDHGPEHIKMVIRRASELVHFMECKLTPYEIYILLSAIHFHDVGNFYGRDRHEQRINKVMDTPEIQPLAGVPTERRIIKAIAGAHGGHRAGNKDTIGVTPEKDAHLAHVVRIHFLAAILRFADELADERSRASRFALSQNDLLGGSEIYHRYSDSLASIDIQEKRIELKFELSISDVVQQYNKKASTAFLVDEIFERTIKMHNEAVYCMRYVRSSLPAKFENMQSDEWLQHPIPIDTIAVKIEIYKNADEGPPIQTIEYSLKESGYPTYSQANIQTLCPDINKQFPGRLGIADNLDGQTIKRLIEEQLRELK